MRAERLLSPAETALRRLDEAADLLNSSQAGEFTLEVADTIRNYLVARFGLESLPESLSGFAEALPAQMVQHQSVLEKFSSLLDFAAAMRFELAVVDMEAIRDSARRVVIKTTLNRSGSGRIR